jgi:hypothetical protein
MQLSYQIIEEIMILADLNDLPAGCLHQVFRMNAKNGVRCSGGSPDEIILEQVPVDKGGDRFWESEWWHTSDGKTGLFTHKIRLRA